MLMLGKSIEPILQPNFVKMSSSLMQIGLLSTQPHKKCKGGLLALKIKLLGFEIQTEH